MGLRLTHNGIDIDQFILLAIYPSIPFFLIGIVANRAKIKDYLKYALQGLSCIVFSIVYLLTVPHGGAQGLGVVLAMFGGLLLVMARNNAIHPRVEEQRNQ